MKKYVQELLKPAESRPVTLIVVSLLDNWEEFHRGLIAAGVKEVQLPDQPPSKPMSFASQAASGSEPVILVEGLTDWSDPNAQARFLNDLEALEPRRSREALRFLVRVGSEIAAPEVVPPLRLDRFEVFYLPPAELGEMWRELCKNLSPPPGVVATLYSETGGSEPLAREILERVGQRATWIAVNEALGTVRGEDPKSLLGRLKTVLYARPELTDAVYRKCTGSDLTDLDELRLLALGIAHREERELAYSSPILEQFVEHYFNAEALAELYQERSEPLREQHYRERLVETSQFLGQRASQRAGTYRRLAELADQNGDEDGFYRHSRKYLEHVGLAESCLFLESVFVPRATDIIAGKGYSDYRASLDRFIDGVTIITGQPSVLLYMRDPANPDVLICHARRPLSEQGKEPPLHLEDPKSFVAQLVRGEKDELDIQDVFLAEGGDRDFARERKLRSLVLWVLRSDGRRFGAVLLENPYSQAHPLSQPVREIARHFLRATQHAVERAGLVASEIDLLSRFKLMLEVARSGKPSDLVELALKVVHTSIPQIRFSAVRLCEGTQQRRLRLVGCWPTGDPELSALSQEFEVVSSETSSFEELPAGDAPLYKPDISTLAEDSPARKLMEARQLRWVMVYELRDNQGQRQGRLTFYGRDEWQPQAEEVELLTGVRQQIALALRNIHETEHNARRHELLTALYHGLAGLAETAPNQESLQSFLASILQVCCQVFRADLGHCLRLWTEDRSWVQLAEVQVGDADGPGRLDLMASGGPIAETIKAKRSQIRVGEGLSGHAVDMALKGKGDLQIFPDVRQVTQFIDYAPGIRSGIAIVLRRRTGRVLGVFTIESKELDHFDQRGVELAQDVARELASAIEFVALFEALASRTRIEEMGEVSADLAHWLGNVLPLTRNRVERALKTLEDPEFTSPNPRRLQIARDGLAEAMGMLALAIQMREELQAPFLQQAPEELDLVEVAREAIETLPQPASPIEIQLEPTGEIPRIQGRRGALVRMVHSLLRNAQDALAEVKKGKILVALEASEGPPREVLLRVEDNGPGLDPARFRELLHPFKSTKSPTQGTGLGTYLVQKVVDVHHGKIRFQTAPGKGMKIEIWLPQGNSG